MVRLTATTPVFLYGEKRDIWFRIVHIIDFKYRLGENYTDRPNVVRNKNILGSVLSIRFFFEVATWFRLSSGYRSPFLDWRNKLF